MVSLGNKFIWYTKCSSFGPIKRLPHLTCPHGSITHSSNFVTTSENT